MSGEIQLLSDRLHYRDGKVDRSYDDVSTLEYVVHDYLERRFNQDVIVEPFATPEAFTAPLDMEIKTYVAGAIRAVCQYALLKMPTSEWAIRKRFILGPFGSSVTCRVGCYSC